MLESDIRESTHWLLSINHNAYNGTGHRSSGLSAKSTWSSTMPSSATRAMGRQQSSISSWNHLQGPFHALRGSICRVFSTIARLHMHRTHKIETALQSHQGCSMLYLAKMYDTVRPLTLVPSSSLLPLHGQVV